MGAMYSSVSALRVVVLQGEVRPAILVILAWPGLRISGQQVERAHVLLDVAAQRHPKRLSAILPKFRALSLFGHAINVTSR